MKKKPLKLCWCKSSNFGDDLNAYIFKKCFSIDVEHARPIYAQAIGIGSIVDRLFLTVREIPLYILSKIIPFCFPQEPYLILSSGASAPFKHYAKKGRFLKSLILKRKIKPIVLRGKRTKEEFEKLLNEDLSDIVLGDLGLLASKLLDIEIKKIYDVGICPHVSQQNEQIFKKIASEIPNSTILDVNVGANEFIKKLAQCKTVISTAMHPLIASDSLGIPNLWVTTRDLDQDFTIYKCKDYYSIFNLEDKLPIDIRKTKITSEFIVQNYKIDKNEVEKIKIKLFNTISKTLKENY